MENKKDERKESLLGKKAGFAESSNFDGRTSDPRVFLMDNDRNALRI